MPKPTLWEGISETLTADLAAEVYKPGEKLPTEAALSQRFGVNRHTIRRAIAALAETGLLHSRRGAGVFVASKPTAYQIGKRVRFHQNVHADGHKATKQKLRIETRRASQKECAALNLDSNEDVHIFEGISLIDDTAMAHFISSFPAQRFPTLPDALTQTTSVTTALGLCGVDDYTRAETRVTAIRATRIQANLLACKTGTPLMRTIGINIDLAGNPVEFGQTWFLGDQVELLLRTSECQ